MIRAFISSFILLPSLVSAAVPEEILRGAWKDPRIQLHEEAAFVTRDAKSYNPLDKADIRIDRGQLEQDDVKYSVRLYPKGYTEHRTTLDFQEALEKNEKAASAAALSQILANRYNLLARVALLKEKRAMASDLATISRKGSKALSYSAQKDRTELKSYLKNKTDLDKLNIKVADIDRDYENLQLELKELSLGKIEDFDLSDFATMEDLQQRLEKAVEKSPAKTLSAQTAELDLVKSRAGMRYDRAKDEKWFDHVEISISEVRREKVFGFEFAFNLPFASAPNLSRVDKEARDLRDRAKLIETVETSDRSFKNGINELKTLLAVHKSLQAAHSRMNLEQMRKASKTISGQDPMLALELQRGWYESREQMLDLEFRIRSLFILYLHESSTIADAPENNYLSKTMKRIL